MKLSTLYRDISHGIVTRLWGGESSYRR